MRVLKCRDGGLPHLNVTFSCLFSMSHFPVSSPCHIREQNGLGIEGAGREGRDGGGIEGKGSEGDR